MKLTIKQDTLAKALNSVSRIANARVGAPILANVLIRTDNNKLIIAATNLEVAIVSTAQANVSEQGAIAVPARLLTEFVNNLPHVDVAIETKDKKLLINAGDNKSTINCSSAEDYPALPESATENIITVSGEQLKSSINSTVFAVNSDIERPVLTGVYINNDNGDIFMVATDGYRLAEKMLTTSKTKISAIVPGSALQEVARQISNDESVDIKYNDEQITFIIGNTKVISRLIDGKFINYKQLITPNLVFTIKIDRTDFIKAVRMTELFSREASGSILLEGNIKDKTLSVKSITSQIGDNISTIPADIKIDSKESDKKECSIGLNSKYLIDVLNVLDGDKVSIRFNGKLSQILVEGEADDYKHMIMPVTS